MLINKMGKLHWEYGRNCQDYGMVSGKVKMVCDGCSQGAHTEVGAKAFVHLMGQGYGVEDAFDRLAELFGQSAENVRDFLCFTIVRAEELDEIYRVSYCGDGYVILEDLEGRIRFQELSDGEYPKYYAYNYVDKNFLRKYKGGVRLEELIFRKEEYRRVGVATDGLRFAVQGEEKIRKAFTEALRLDQEAKLKRFVNRYQTFFKDDLTIAW